RRRERPVPASGILNPQATMQLEFHQLDRRWEHLRVRQPHRQRHLMASLAESGQQTPIVVILSAENRDRYLVIDGHKRIAAQQQLREGAIAAQLAMKYLVPVARVNGEDCARMAAAFVQHRCDTRQAGQLYAAWRDGSRVVRERILAEPELFLKTQRQPQPTRPAATGLEHDLEMAVAIL